MECFPRNLANRIWARQSTRFLNTLLTPDERDAVGLRLQIVAQLLDKNLSQREIQQNLNTSAATITRGSNMLKTMDPDFINWVKNQLDEQAAKN